MGYLVVFRTSEQLPLQPLFDRRCYVSGADQSRSYRNVLFCTQTFKREFRRIGGEITWGREKRRIKRRGKRD